MLKRLERPSLSNIPRHSKDVQSTYPGPPVALAMASAYAAPYTIAYVQHFHVDSHHREPPHNRSRPSSQDHHPNRVLIGHRNCIDYAALSHTCIRYPWALAARHTCSSANNIRVLFVEALCSGNSRVRSAISWRQVDAALQSQLSCPWLLLFHLRDQTAGVSTEGEVLGSKNSGDGLPQGRALAVRVEAQ